MSYFTVPVLVLGNALVYLIRLRKITFWCKFCYVEQLKRSPAEITAAAVSIQVSEGGARRSVSGYLP